MAVLRRRAKAQQVVLRDTSPYQSRMLEIETDGVTTAAYLRKVTPGPDGTPVPGDDIAAVWVANHEPAPRNLDLVRLNAGQVPPMPAAHTKQPGGVLPLDPRALEVVWFEEGDGVAVLQGGAPLCAIPSWSDMERGVPGYSRDAVTQSPLAFPLDEEIEELGPRMQQARSYWPWRQSGEFWPAFQQSMLGHLMSKLGPGERYWDIGGARPPAMGVSERPATDDRPYTVLSTVGMSCQRMPAVELYTEDVSDYARIELALATTMPSEQAARVFLWLAQYPWHSVTWFGPGHNVQWYHTSDTFPLGGGREGVLLLEDPGMLAGPPAVDLQGFGFGGDPVRWLWLFPVTEAERQLAKVDGSAALVQRLAENKRSWVVS